MSFGAVEENDLFLVTIFGQNCLLEINQELHELSLVGGSGQVHHSAILETLADTPNNCTPHLPVVLLVEHGVVSSAPGTFRYRVRGVRGFVNPNQAGILGGN